MSALTAVLYAALAVYLGGWYADQWIGNFSLLLFVLTVVTLAYWLAERFSLQARARGGGRGARDPARAAPGRIGHAGHHPGRRQRAAPPRKALLAQPWWLDWTAGLFPVILIVFLLRSFLFEPFKIPSGSMVPTLLVGDLILVNKFHYGVRLPVINKKIVANHDPERGDVMVFRYPVDPRVDYIKRVVGLPGRRDRLPQSAADDQRQAGRGASRRASTTTRRRCATCPLFSECAGQRATTASWSIRSARPTTAAATRAVSPTPRTAAIQPRGWCARFPRATTS